MNAPARNQPCPCGSGKKFKHCCAHLSNKPELTRQKQHSSPSLQVTFDQALQWHQQGRLHKAEALYQTVLQHQPNHADALHLLGLIRHQLGDHMAAHDLVSQAISVQPGSAIFHNNLGEICRALGRYDAAEAHYAKALSLQADFAEAHRNLGLAYLDSGQTERAVTLLTETTQRFPRQLGSHWALGQALMRRGDFATALAAYERGLILNPADPALLCAMGSTLKAQGNTDLAIAHYLHAIRLQPDVAELHHNLALLYQQQGEHEAAIACLERELELRPRDESAQHLLAALQHQSTDRAPASYVRETFDFYADNFDAHLVGKLEYQAPELLMDLLRAAAPEARDWNILDLGCGTGLFGEQVHAIKRHLTGIDLSPRMVDKARQRGIYDELIVGDLLDYLADTPDRRFDLIAATDVFIYLGNLQPVFQQAGRLLVPGGWFCFSIEAAPPASENFVLDITGRYRHNSDYLEKLTRPSNFSIVLQTSFCLRKEHAKPVDGRLYLLQKPM